MKLESELLDSLEDLNKALESKDPFQRNELIAELVTEGQSFQKVGGQVGLSPSTVARIYKRHRSEHTSESSTH